MGKRADLLRVAHERGLLTREQLDAALSVKKGDPVEAAVRKGFITKDEVEGLALLAGVEERTGETTAGGPRIDVKFWEQVAGKRFGRYKLEEKIGEGATAFVISARDETLRRDVALKILKEGALGIPSHVERFNREARAMARLRHPNIIAVHDIGTEQGWTFFSMDLVVGRSMEAVLADEQVEQAQLLEIIEKVAGACHFAHGQGIVHRDLKPSNVLVDESFEPYVTDFGIARLTVEDERLTQTGTILGTAHYMSPEHVSGNPNRIDSRSDVFSLGSILYEAATGRPPFSGRGSLAVYNAIATTDPVRPRKIAHGVSPDLEAVIFKALDRNPDRRYASALELAEDLERLRNGLPVKAKRVSAAGVLLRQLLRHRAIVFTGASAVLALIVLVVVAIVGAQERSAHQVSAAELQEVRREQAVRDRLEPEFARVRDKVHEARRLRGEEGIERARVLGAEVVEEVRRLLKEDPEHAEKWVYLAYGYEIMGQTADSAQAYDRAVQQAAGSALPYIARARFGIRRYVKALGSPPVHWRGGRPVFRSKEESEEAKAIRVGIERDLRRIRESGLDFSRQYETLIDGAMNVFGPTPEAGEELLTEAIQLDRNEVLAWRLRGISRFMQRNLDGAEADLNEALKLSLATADEWRYRAIVRHGQGRLEEALEDLNRAAELDPRSFRTHVARGNVYYDMADFQAAIGEYSRGAEIEPDNPDAYNNRGNAKYSLKDYEGAISDYNRAIEIKPEKALAYSNRGNALMEMGDYQGAMEDQTRAIELRPELAGAYVNRSRARWRSGDREGAWSDMEEALRVDGEYLHAYTSRAVFHASQGDHQAAMDDLTRALEIDPLLSSAYVDRGNALQGLQDFEGAIEDYNKAIELFPGLWQAWNNRGNAKLFLGDLGGAMEDFEKAIELNRTEPIMYSNRARVHVSRAELQDDPAPALRQAVRDIRKALELALPGWPNHDALKEELGRLLDLLAEEEY